MTIDEQFKKAEQKLDEFDHKVDKLDKFMKELLVYIRDMNSKLEELADNVSKQCDNRIEQGLQSTQQLSMDLDPIDDEERATEAKTTQNPIDLDIGEEL